ncbi:hypothetical protein [Embleya sp. NPDC020630]|uniref:hypothetical protein n=1 Tax=Embleya sp. NPDC020630 TaxID=3363979 RepID=UPI003787B6FC
MPDPTARVAAELGAPAWKIAYERWADPANDDTFGELARRTLAEVRASLVVCGGSAPE